MRMHKGFCSNQNPLKDLPGWPWFRDDERCNICGNGNQVFDIPNDVMVACDVLSRAMRAVGPTNDAIIFANTQKALIKLAHMGKLTANV